VNARTSLGPPLSHLGRAEVFAGTDSADPATNNRKGGNSHAMSLTSDFPLASNVLLLFKSDLQGQYSELTRAIDSTHKEIAHSQIPGPAMLSMSPAATLPRKRFLQLTARTGHNCAKLRLPWNALPPAILASVLPVEAPLASNGYKRCPGQTTVSSARSNRSRAESSE
jgi:hypothetical protein